MTSLRQKQIQAHIDEEHRIKHVIIKRLKKNIGSHTTPERQPDAKINNNVEKTASRLVDILHESCNTYKYNLVMFSTITSVQLYLNTPYAQLRAAGLSIEPASAIALIKQFNQKSAYGSIFTNSLDIFKKFNDVIREYISPSLSNVDRSDIKLKLVKLQPVIKACAIGVENLFYGFVYHLQYLAGAPVACGNLSDAIVYVLNNLALLVNINDMIYSDRFELLTDASLSHIKREYKSQLSAVNQTILKNILAPDLATYTRFNNAQNLPRLK